MIGVCGRFTYICVMFYIFVTYNMNLNLSKPGTCKRTYIFQLHILRMIKIALNLWWQPPRPIAQHITMLAHGFTSRKCESLGQTCATMGFVLLPRGSPSVASWASLCCLVGLVGGFWKIIVVACANRMFISEKFTANFLKNIVVTFEKNP